MMQQFASLSSAKLSFEPPLIAHRGASAYAPENTMLAFVKALQLGARWIECDVMLSSCGKPIIFHDETLNRITQLSGNVNQFPYKFLATLDAGSWFQPIFAGERIPSLAMLLDFISRHDLSINIELKAFPGSETELVKKVLEEIAQISDKLSLHGGRILFSSFSYPLLVCLREQAPECLIGCLLDEWKPGWEKMCESLRSISVHVNHQILSMAAVHQVKRMGKQLLCYTVNEPNRAKLLYSWGVDAIFTDRPDMIII